MSDPTVRDLIVVLPWEGIWLGLDVTTGDQVMTFETLPQDDLAHPGAITVCPTAPAPVGRPQGGLLVSADLFWSLLDPLHAASVDQAEHSDRVQAETALRQIAQRFRTRLAWWQHLDANLRERCQRLLKGFEPDLRPLLQTLDNCAAGGNNHDFLGVADDVIREMKPPEPSPEAVLAWLGANDGLGALYGPSFAARSEQAEMGREVAAALASGRALMVEAGTGVGKTLAYLVPLVAQVVAAGTRGVVSTHTRALQSQILEQDLPRLRPLLGDRKFAMLMGRRNYLCLRQRQAFLSEPMEDLAGALRAVAFRLWLHETRSGLRDEIAGHPLLSPETGRLFDGTEVCLPGLCYESDRCFVQRARRRARAADILVVNHSLLLHDQKAGHTLLGDIDHLIVDEAHRLPDVTLETHTVTVGLRRVRELSELLGRTRGGGTLPERVALVAAGLQRHGVEGQRAADYCQDFARAARRLAELFEEWWQGLGVHLVDGGTQGGYASGRVRIRDKDEAFGPVRAETASLEEGLGEAAGVFARLTNKVSGLEDLSPGLEDSLAQLAQAGQKIRQLHTDIRFLTADPGENWVTWWERGRRGGVATLGATLLEAGQVLRGYWQTDDCRPIMTSATLAVGDDFTHMMSELGLTRRRPPTLTHTSPSPFDYHRQALVLVPKHFPAPGSSDFGAAVGEVLTSIAQGCGRKTLGLFTSYRLLREAHETLARNGLTEDGPSAGQPIVLAQSPNSGTGSLLSRFRRHRRAMLLGTNTFWEGVDFPGEDLEILVVTKLPFLVPSDPWVEARCERVKASGENPFTKFIVRDAVLRMRQGFGRLIRRTGDRGVVIILDNRLHSKNYGTTFLRSLPLMPDSFGDNADLLERVNGFFWTAASNQG